MLGMSPMYLPSEKRKRLSELVAKPCRTHEENAEIEKLKSESKQIHECNMEELDELLGMIVEMRNWSNTPQLDMWYDAVVEQIDRLSIDYEFSEQDDSEDATRRKNGVSTSNGEKTVSKTGNDNKEGFRWV